MNKYMIYLNTKRCIGCHACEIHCKVNKKLPFGPILCEIDHDPLKSIRGVPKTEFSFRSCYQCDEPYCASICPTGALSKREDGIVMLDEEKCIGCMACAGACPWGIPQLNHVGNKMVKCDFCVDRVDGGLKPVCVTKCTTHALRFVSLTKL